MALEEALSYLTTFHTSFGQYRWRGLPFGINSAPVVFPRKKQELIEGLSRIEEVSDDFIVVGRGNTVEEANRDHDVPNSFKNLLIITLFADFSQGFIKLLLHCIIYTKLYNTGNVKTAKCQYIHTYIYTYTLYIAVL